MSGADLVHSPYVQDHWYPAPSSGDDGTSSTRLVYVECGLRSSSLAHNWESVFVDRIGNGLTFTQRVRSLGGKASIWGSLEMTSDDRRFSGCWRSLLVLPCRLETARARELVFEGLKAISPVRASDVRKLKTCIMEEAEEENFYDRYYSAILFVDGVSLRRVAESVGNQRDVLDALGLTPG